MFCPQCGQERMSHATSFCSRCGFLLTGIAELLQTGGVIPIDASMQRLPVGSSPRKQGLKKGLFIFLLTFLVVPLIALISVALHLPPIGIAISSILLFVGGLLRMAYALMFESAISGQPTLEGNFINAHGMLDRQRMHPSSLPPQQSMPVSTYGPPQAGKWRDTSELQPTSVTESTTRLLDKDQ